MGKKIRDAEVKKIPFMIIVGEQEEQTETLSVRQHGGDDLGTLSVAEFSKIIEDEINKTLKQF
jgi:threonyl-tRNA synthetase